MSRIEAIAGEIESEVEDVLAGFDDDEYRATVSARQFHDRAFVTVTISEI